MPEDLIPDRGKNQHLRLVEPDPVELSQEEVAALMEELVLMNARTQTLIRMLANKMEE